MRTEISYKAIFKIAYPVMLSALAQNVINITDTAFLARVSEADVGAVGLGGLFYVTLLMLGFGLGMGGQILIARRFGEGDSPAAGRVFLHVLYLLAVVGVALVLVLRFLSEPLLSRLVTSPEVLQKILIYLERRSWGMAFAQLSLAFRFFYTGVGKTRVIGANTVFFSTVNAIAAYALIFGKFGFPEQGIAGAGTAAVIAEFSSLVFFGVYSFFRLDRAAFHLRRPTRPVAALFGDIARIASPMVVMYVVSLGGWFAFFAIIEKLGERALAISNIVRSVYMVFFVPILGFQAVTSALVSRVIGEGRGRELGVLIRRTAALSFGITACASLLAHLSPRTVFLPYTSDALLMAEALPSLRVVLVAVLIFSVATILFNCVSGTGDTKASMAIECAGVGVYLAFAVTAVFLFRARVEVVWLAEWLYWLLLGGLAYARLKSGRWRTLKV